MVIQCLDVITGDLYSRPLPSLSSECHRRYGARRPILRGSDAPSPSGSSACVPAETHQLPNDGTKAIWLSVTVDGKPALSRQICMRGNWLWEYCASSSTLQIQDTRRSPSGGSCGRCNRKDGSGEAGCRDRRILFRHRGKGYPKFPRPVHSTILLVQSSKWCSNGRGHAKCRKPSDTGYAAAAVG